MDDYDVSCDECGVFFSRQNKVVQYVVNAHTFKFEKTMEFCPACARIEADRRTYGEVEKWAVEAFAKEMDHHYGDPVDVVWLQGDEHKWLFHVRRLARSA